MKKIMLKKLSYIKCQGEIPVMCYYEIPNESLGHPTKASGRMQSYWGQKSII